MSIESCTHEQENEIYILAAFFLRRIGDGPYFRCPGNAVAYMDWVWSGNLSDHTFNGCRRRLSLLHVPPGDRRHLYPHIGFVDGADIL